MALQEFRIVRGVMPLPGYTDSPETDVVVLNLMSGGIGTPDGLQYSPRTTQTKNGGVWAESSLSDGRKPLALPYSNVIESVNFKLSSSTFKELNTKLKEIKLFIAECKKFGVGHSFIDPVYIHFRQTDEVPAQYALLFNLDFEVTYQDTDPETLTPIALFTLSWEREYGWRAIPPGTSPVYYAQLSRGLIPGTDFDYTDLNPLSSASLVYKTDFTNRLEYDFGAGQDSPTITENYITIPKEDIPGDLPALCMIDLGRTTSTENYRKIYIGHSITPRLPVPASFSSDFNDNFVFAAADGDEVGTPTASRPTGVGVLSNASTVTQHALNLAWAGAVAEETLVQWGRGAGGSANNIDYQIRANSLRGKYNVYIRSYLVSGTAPSLFLRFEVDSTFNIFTDTNSYNPRANVGAGVGIPANRYNIDYLGTVSLPVGSKTETSRTGEGLYNPDFSTLNILLRGSSTGATTVQFCDIILIPYDIANCEVDLDGQDTSVAETIAQVSIDNTMYLTHGQPLDKVQVQPFSGTLTTQFVKGTIPMLIPGVNNRLHILIGSENGAGEEYSSPDYNDLTVGVNIIPRWSGVRDE